MTQGYGKRGKGYVFHNRPKKVFIRTLHKEAKEMLKAPFLSPRLVSVRKDFTMDFNEVPLEGTNGLMSLLKTICDPRKKRGIRHPATALLALSLGACLSGAKSYEAIAQWGQSLSREALLRLGFKRWTPPSEPTIRRFLQSVDAEEIDGKMGLWLLNQMGGMKGQALAIDGKTLRGSHDREKKPIQLLSAVVAKEGIIVGQKKVKDKTNEIPMVQPLLDPLPIEGAVVTLDALHTQRETARYLVEDKQADYLLIAKDNQETLKNNIESLQEEDFSPCVCRSGERPWAN
jgi:hypothetical protein